jgi:ABC-type uncharacterized transport system permease subunit
MKRIDRHKLAESEIFVSSVSSVLAILIGLLFGFALMVVVSPGESLRGFWIILVGGFNGGLLSIGSMIVFATPLIFTGLSVAFAYRTGLFNIGASGQLMMGALAAVVVGIPQWWTYPDGVRTAMENPFLVFGSWLWVVATLAAFLAGAFWGFIPGALKAFFNVNEVVATIMLNYIAMFLNSLIVTRYLFNSLIGKAFMVSPNAMFPRMGLENILTDGVRTSQANASFVIAIVAVVAIYIILNRTVFGFEVKAVGFNREAAQYAGMNAKLNLIYSMTISGALAGLGGASLFLYPGRNLDPVLAILPQGFDGIAIALLGLGSPIGVFLAGLFFSSLKVGGQFLQLLTFRIEIIDIIISVIIYMAALSLILNRTVIKWLRRGGQ